MTEAVIQRDGVIPGEPAEPLSPQGQVRRRVLKGMAGGTSLAVLTACGIRQDGPRQAPAQSSGATREYDLQQDGLEWFDQNLAAANHPSLASIRFSFDPDRDEGSLVLNSRYTKPGEQRMLNAEITPDPGIFFCMPREVKAGDLAPKQHPIIRFKRGNAAFVKLGFRVPSEECSVGYKDMRVYRVEKTEGNLIAARFVDVETLNPADLKARPNDQEALKYFKVGCA